MHYVYAIVFAVLISPLQSWLAGLSGLFFNDWARFWSDLAGGALFANAALVSTEVLIRMQLLPDSARKARPKLSKWIGLAALTITFLSLFPAFVLWQRNGDYQHLHPIVYWIAGAFCVVALAILLLSIKLEGGAKRALRRVANSKAAA